MPKVNADWLYNKILRHNRQIKEFKHIITYCQSPNFSLDNIRILKTNDYGLSDKNIENMFSNMLVYRFTVTEYCNHLLKHISIIRDARQKAYLNFLVFIDTAQTSKCAEGVWKYRRQAIKESINCLGDYIVGEFRGLVEIIIDYIHEWPNMDT